MNQPRKMFVTLHTLQGINKNSTVLRSDDDYERWYLQQFDFSMFSDTEIKKAMEEERPDYYPCITLLQEDSYEVTYLGEDLVMHWFRTLHTETSAPI